MRVLFLFRLKCASNKRNYIGCDGGSASLRVWVRQVEKMRVLYFYLSCFVASDLLELKAL
jgi:hypothetical protein